MRLRRWVGQVQSNSQEKILLEPDNWTALEIISRLSVNLPQADPTLHMATPNYDLLAELSLSAKKILYTTGFVGGVIRKLDWS